MNTTFTNVELQSVFSEKGYVILPHLLSKNDLDILTMASKRFENEMKEPFHTSHFSSDIHYKASTQTTIVETVFPKIKHYLNDYIPVFANFMVKKANGNNFLQMHADWTYVDEDKYRSISVWIPFVDTNKRNGCLGVIEGSHKFMNKIRGPRIQQNNYERDRIWVKKYGKLLPVNAGDAIVFDHALLHFSPQNETNQFRPALNLSLTPRSADLIHFCVPEGAVEIEKYGVKDLAFFLHYDNWQRPRLGKAIETIPINSIQFIDSHMENYGANYLTKKEQLVSFIRELFSTS
jgi:ectoine hydroxylase-related dioxygenase (phytanoyl-CoA dioxygenase family)